MSKPSSDFNLQAVNTQELFEHFRATIDYGGNALVIGQRGSGKTSISNQAVLASGYKSVCWSLATFERVDLSGYPQIFSPKDPDYIQFLFPHFFRSLLEGKEKVVLILDELDKADFSILAPLLDILQIRAVNGRPLTNLHAILMTGNLPAEGGKRPASPLLDRTEKYLLEAHIRYWQDWAGSKGKIHPSIIAYLSDNPHDLIGEVDQRDNYSERSPRGWENASKLIYYGEKHKWSQYLITSKVSGCIGKAAGIRYSAYFNHYQVLLPIIDRVWEGDKIKEFKKLTPSEKIVATMILCSRVGRSLDDGGDNKPTEQVRAVGRFLLTQVDLEMALLGLRAGVGNDRILKLNGDPSYEALLDKLVERSGL